jgi:hypothetical protein
MFFVFRFILVWTIWLIFADKKRWKELFPVGIFAGLLGSTTDSMSTHYKLWHYQSTSGWEYGYLAAVLGHHHTTFHQGTIGIKSFTGSGCIRKVCSLFLF